METTADRAGAAPAGSRGGGRLPLLDVLRGVAILGTLATNIWIFASPGGEWAVLSSTSGGAPESAVEDTGATVGAALEAAMRFAANGKFLALLTLLFGAGLAIQFRSAARRATAGRAATSGGRCCCSPRARCTSCWSSPGTC